MPYINIKVGDVPVGRFEFAVQLALIVVLCFAAAGLWPFDLLNGPSAAITFPQVLRAVSAPGLLLASAAWLYLLVKPRLNERALVDEPSHAESRDKAPPQLGTSGYRSH